MGCKNASCATFNFNSFNINLCVSLSFVQRFNQLRPTGKALIHDEPHSSSLCMIHMLMFLRYVASKLSLIGVVCIPRYEREWRQYVIVSIGHKVDTAM